MIFLASVVMSAYPYYSAGKRIFKLKQKILTRAAKKVMKNLKKKLLEKLSQGRGTHFGSRK